LTGQLKLLEGETMRLGDWNGFDWLLISILLISMGVAYRRGLVRSICGLAGFFGGLLLASRYYTLLADWFVRIRMIGLVPTSRIVAYLLIIVLTVILLEVAGLMLQKTLRVVGLGFLDRLLGVAFGFVRGCVIGIAVLLVTTNFAPQSWVVTKSVVSPYLFAVAHDVSFLVPQYLQQLMASGAFNLKQAPPDWINQH
jgi:membrane protein required for colicin V production